jgi:hypothetical protein
MNYKDKTNGDIVTAWQWDGKDEVSLKQMLFGLLSYTVEDGEVSVRLGRFDYLKIVPGTFIVNGPATNQLRTFNAGIFAKQFEKIVVAAPAPTQITHDTEKKEKQS